MGTNYYLASNGKHLGKKSAAGLYCWDCEVTLCKQRKDGIHQSKSDWHEKCPKCGKPAEEETLSESSAGRELGFNKEKYQKKTGVKSCSSFTWAIPKEEFLKLSKRKRVKDEYDRFMSVKKFLKILEECPVQYFHQIGKYFS